MSRKLSIIRTSDEQRQTGLFHPEDNVIDYSNYRAFSLPRLSPAYSIKYVISGREVFFVDGIKYEVKPGQLLLVHPFCCGFADYSNDFETEAICVFISHEIMNKVYSSMYSSNDIEYATSFADQIDPGTLLTLPLFDDESVCYNLLPEVKRLAGSENLNKGTGDIELFFRIAEAFLRDQKMVTEMIRRINNVKMSTRKELYRRLAKGREYILENYDRDISIGEVALAANISEFHFYRLFRKVFGISPYGYLTKIRMENAWKMILDAKAPISYIALATGFADLHAFSKSFKKYFGKPPSGYQNQK